MWDFDSACLRVELTRARLVYGKWLRRNGRRRNARDQLGRAYEIFHSAGSSCGQAAAKPAKASRDASYPP